MLATRIIPTILSKHGQLVKGQGFQCDRVVGNALQAAKVHALRGVDELMILDVTATLEGREPDYDLVEKLTKDCFSPVTYGGGIKSVEHVNKLLRSGADKVCLGNKALDFAFVEQLSNKYGRQCIVVSLDVNKYADILSVAAYARDFQEHGAGEILLQFKDHDGTMKGYKHGYIDEVCHSVKIPVIASGGCSGYEDMYNAIKAGASAVAAGALFQFTDCTPKGAAEYLVNRGLEVRVA